MSKDFNGKPRLIGELCEENGEYTFEYKVGGKFHEWFLRLKEFPNPQKVYKGDEVRPFIEMYIPEKNSKYLQQALKSANLSEYDEWGFLEYIERIKFDPHGHAYFYKDIPQGAIIYA
jgi:hypothetical protein